MTLIPIIPLSKDDIERICTGAAAVLSRTESICTSTSLPDVEAHQTEIEQSQGELDKLRNFLDAELGNLKNSIAAVKAMDADLSRHFERCKRSYWALKTAQPKEPYRPRQ